MLRHALARIDDARQKVVERLGLLQLAQARRVGRGNVDGDVARHGGEALDQPHVVGDTVEGILVGADIDADDSFGPSCPARRSPRPRRQALEHGIGALRIEAEPVDDAFVGVEPEQARARIASLRQRRDGADLDEAETEPQQRVGHFGILVEARGHPDRVGKVQAEGAHRQPLVAARSRRQRGELQHADRESVGVFRVERMQQGPREPLEKADHGSSSGKRWRPSAARVSGRVQRTAVSGSGP